MHMTPDQRDLMHHMSKLSEDHYCAGWLVNLEYRLWSVLLGDSQAFARGHLTGAEIQKLRDLSTACGGWIHWDDSAKAESFIPLDEWRVKFESSKDGRV